MKTFKIEVDNIEYCVTLKEDGNYLVETDEADLYVLSSEADDNSQKWSLVKGHASEDLIEALGLAIKDHEKNHQQETVY
jgi:hypothetical protein